MNKQIKKVLVNFTGKKGGGPEYAYEMTKALSKFEIDIYVIISKDVSNINEWRTLNVKKLIEIDTYTNLFGLFKRWFKLTLFTNLVKKYKLPESIDYIYVPMEQPLSKVINSKFKRAKVLLTIHDVDSHSGDNKIYNFFNNFLNFNTRKKSYKILLLSKSLVPRYVEKYGYDKDNIVILKHGVFSRYSLINPSPIKLDFISTTNFLFFGRISEYKGIDILLKAYKSFSSSQLNSTLTIAGFGDLHPYQKTINELSNINLINRWINDQEISYLFKIPNVVLITPYKDASQSGVISLANLLKVPVISSNSGGLIEQVIHNHSGLVFNIDSVIDLINKMITLHTNKEHVAFLVSNAYKNIISNWEYSADKIYKEIIGI